MISITMARRLARISLREFAMLPLSSCRLQSLSLFSFFAKSNCAVLDTISLIWVIGLVITSPISTPITTEIATAISIPTTISMVMRLAALFISDSGAVSTYFMPLVSVL